MKPLNEAINSLWDTGCSLDISTLPVCSAPENLG